jgi:hypothetical protein
VSFSSCAGLQIVSGSLLIPQVGAWTADLQLAGSQSLSGTVTVLIGNLSLSGTVFRSAAYGGQTKVRLVGGAGGWRTAVKAQGYGSSNGVQLSAVLQDAAAACGETMGPIPSQNIGNGYARIALSTSVASDVLWHMIDLGFIPAWYVDVTGTTQVTAWPSTTIQTPFTVTDQRTDEGVAVIATEDYASWMPGCSFTNPLTQGTVPSAGAHYLWDANGKFRFEVLTASAPSSAGTPTETGDRVLGPLQQVIQKETAHTRLNARYRYTTSNPSASSVDCSPKNNALGLPDLQSVPLHISGSSKVTPASGVDCDIEFLDGYIPVCTWIDQTPTEVDVASGTNPAGYLGAQVQTFFPPVVTGTAIIPPSPSPVPITLNIPSPLTGIVTQGSSVVKVPT